MAFRHMMALGVMAVAATAVSAADPKPSKDILAAVADPARPAADTARDAARKPAEIVAFAGVKPGDTVVELLPGGGYYTRILAKAVGPKGKLYTVITRPAQLERMKTLVAGYPNVEVIVSDLDKLTAPAGAGPIALVWTTENYHDMHNGPTANIAAVNKAVFNLLRPGGVFFVEDHAGIGAEATSTVHRMDPAIARTELTAAGFKLEAESKLLANPKDPRNVGTHDPKVEGTSDKFAFRLRKPK